MIPLFRPSVGKEELRALARIFRTGWIGLGPRTKEFERRFAATIGRRYGIGVNSCTAALHLALQVLDLKRGGEVIIPAISFISCAHAARYNSLTPVFADVDPETLVLDPRDVERKITKRTRAIMAVHFAGQPCDMDAILRIARAHKLWVIEDCANAAGSYYKNRPVGAMGDIACFSFEAKKNITTGDGGMILLDRLDWNRTLRRLRWLGINRDTWRRFTGKSKYTWYYEVAEIGYKYNMNDIQAAIGLVQLGKMKRIQKKKESIIASYQKAFSGIPELTLPPIVPWAHPHWWLYIVRVNDRNSFMAYLADQKITTGVHFMPLHLHPLYRTKKANVPVAEREWKRMVTLPLYPDMRHADRVKIISAVQSYFSRRSRAGTVR